MPPEELPPPTKSFTPSKPLRVCCYGSSSATTPTPYLNEAYNLGLHLAKRGHTTVNGGGTVGCMGSTTQGAIDGNGTIVGVIHEMFVVDGSDWMEVRNNGDEKTSMSSSHPMFRKGNHELVVAGGDDLQERKKLLVDGADAIAVLPGGPGTWDELWEMACAKNIGLTSLPIVCVNVNGYYDPFRDMLQRAYEDTLIPNNPPEAIVKFVETAEEAVDWIEAECGRGWTDKKWIKKRSQSFLRKGSVMAPPLGLENRGSFFGSLWGGNNGKSSSEKDESGENRSSRGRYYWEGNGLVSMVTVFVAGLAIGLTAASKIKVKA